MSTSEAMAALAAMQNKTSGDAFQRVAVARAGCLNEASNEYLEALLWHVQTWAKVLEEERVKRIGDRDSGRRGLPLREPEVEVEVEGDGMTDEGRMSS